jgi:thiosulfate/3-mercaptopyruvate sulfurtransferase
MLRWVGHEAVAVLDGGLPAWQAAGLPLSVEQAKRPLGNLQRRPALVSTVGAADILRGGLKLVDARAPDRFRGENETLDPVGGHIPGAANRFFRNNLQADGRFKPAGTLRAEWSALLPSTEGAVMQCGSGVTACHNLLALEAAGLPGAALYPGSWSEWCAEPSRPVATGD